MIDPGNHSDASGRAPGEVGIKVDIGFVDRLAEAMRVRELGGRVHQEASEDVVRRVGVREEAGPGRAPRWSVVADTAGVPAVVQERSLGVVIGIDRYEGRELRAVEESRARRALVQYRAVQV